MSTIEITACVWEIKKKEERERKKRGRRETAEHEKRRITKEEESSEKWRQMEYAKQERETKGNDHKISIVHSN